MTAFTPASPSFSLSLRALRRSMAGAAFAAAFLMLALPDCCLTGRHVDGFGMDAFAFVCHGAR
jgi:hypothetical protein